MPDETTPAPSSRRAQPITLGVLGAVLVAASTLKYPWVEPMREALAGLGYTLGLIARGSDLFPRRGP